MLIYDVCMAVCSFLVRPPRFEIAPKLLDMSSNFFHLSFAPSCYSFGKIERGSNSDEDLCEKRFLHFRSQ